MNALPTERIGVIAEATELANILKVDRGALDSVIGRHRAVTLVTTAGSLRLASLEPVPDGRVKAMLERHELRVLLKAGLVSGENRDFYVKLASGQEVHLEATSISFSAEAKRVQP